MNNLNKNNRPLLLVSETFSVFKNLPPLFFYKTLKPNTFCRKLKRERCLTVLHLRFADFCIYYVSITSLIYFISLVYFTYILCLLYFLFVLYMSSFLIYCVFFAHRVLLLLILFFQIRFFQNLFSALRFRCTFPAEARKCRNTVLHIGKKGYLL